MLRPSAHERWAPGAPGDDPPPLGLAPGVFLLAPDLDIQSCWDVHDLLERALTAVDPACGYNRRALVRRLHGERN